MNLNGNLEMISTAFHEASHAAAAHVLGGTLGKVWIQCNQGSWTGKSEVKWNEPDVFVRKRKIFFGAVVGPFGQAKCRATAAWNEARFDLSDDLTSPENCDPKRESAA